MPRNKDLKRLIRARMDKTGESYTAARAHLVSESPRPLPREHRGIPDKETAEEMKAYWGARLEALKSLLAGDAAR